MKQRKKGSRAGSVGKWMQYFHIAHNTPFYPLIFAQALSSKGTVMPGWNWKQWQWKIWVRGGGGPGVLLSRFGGLVCFCTSLTWHYSPLRRQALCKNVGVKTCIMGNVKILHSLSHTTGMSPFLPLLHFFILHFSYFLPSFCAIYVGCQTIKWYAPCS